MEILTISRKQGDRVIVHPKLLLNKWWTIVISTILFASLPKRKVRYYYFNFIDDKMLVLRGQRICLKFC